MSFANIHGVSIHYQVFGTAGPWIALSPGGRQGMDELLPIAGLLSAQGFRVVLHDRRNCGASDVSITGEGAEYEVWADDLHSLMEQLGALPAYFGGSSSGCRMSIVLALRHPESVLGLLLWRLTGGARASERLVEKYYQAYADAALRGGMAAVCDTEHFSAMIHARPENRTRLMGMDPGDFVETMHRWSQYFIDGASMPIIGADEQALRTLDVPACVIPGNDLSHPRQVGELVARLLPRSELHHLGLPDDKRDVAPEEDWVRQDPLIAELLASFIRRHHPAPRNA